MADGFYADDPDRLSYPEAEGLVQRYLQRGAQRPRTTSVDVLQWSDYPNDQHNRLRVYEALKALCAGTDDNWAGRTVFEIPEEIKRG
jgi:hypothetical protein